MLADETYLHRACVVTVMSMVVGTSQGCIRLMQEAICMPCACMDETVRVGFQAPFRHLESSPIPQASCALFGFPLLQGRLFQHSTLTLRLDDPWRQRLVTSTNVTPAVGARQCGLNSPNVARRRATVIGFFAAHPLGGGFEGEANIIVVGGTTSVKALRLPPSRGLMTTLVP